MNANISQLVGVSRRSSGVHLVVKSKLKQNRKLAATAASSKGLSFSSTRSSELELANIIFFLNFRKEQRCIGKGVLVFTLLYLLVELQNTEYNIHCILHLTFSGFHQFRVIELEQSFNLIR